MNKQWQAFLKSHNASAADNGDTLFDNQSTQAKCWKSDLSMLGIIRISGADKKDFLQGQLTSDTRNISPEKSQFTSYCTPKGRMIANMRIVQSGDDWLMILPASRLPVVQKRLQMFVMRADVQLEDISDTHCCIGVKGDCAAQLAASASLPATSSDCVQSENALIIRVEDNNTRFMVIADTAAMQSIWEKLDESEAVDTSVWRLADIHAAIPTVYEETVEAFIPQMTNLQLLDAVSFTKGCYTGQEVVARMQYLGKLKRRMYPVAFTTEQPVTRGTNIFSPQSQSGQGAGRIVDLVKTTENNYAALAVLEISSVAADSLHLFDNDGPQVSVSEPPYDFEIDES